MSCGVYEPARSFQPIPLGGTTGLVTEPTRRTKQSQRAVNSFLLSPSQSGLLPAKRTAYVKRSLTRTLSSRAQHLKREARLREIESGGSEENELPRNQSKSASDQRRSPSSRESSGSDSGERVTSLSTVIITCPGDDKQGNRDNLWAYQNHYRRPTNGSADANTPLYRGLPQRKKSAQKTRSRSTAGAASGIAYAGSNSSYRSWIVTEWKNPHQYGDVNVTGTNTLGVEDSSCNSESGEKSGGSSGPGSPGSMRAVSAKMPYRLRPLGAGDYSPSSSHKEWVVVSDGSQTESAEGPSPRTNVAEESVKLPRITPHYSIHQDVQNSSSLYGGQFKQRMMVPGLSPIIGNGLVTHLNRDSTCNDNRIVTKENVSIASTWQSVDWDSRQQSLENNPDSDLEEGVIDTDCSEDGHCDNSDDSDKDDEFEDTSDGDMQQHNKSVTKLPVLNSLEKEGIETHMTQSSDSLKPEIDLLVQSMSVDSFAGRNKTEKQENTFTGPDQDSTYSHEVDGNAENGIQLSEEAQSNGVLKENVQGDGEFEELRKSGDETDDMVNEDKKDIDESKQVDGCVIINVKDSDNKVISEIPLEPCKKARTYKRRSYRLRDLTAGFRNEMYKNHKLNQISDQDDDRLWFEDILKSSQVVDDTVYDSYARRPLPKIKNPKHLVSKVYESKPPEPAPMPTPKQSETPTPPQQSKDQKVNNVASLNSSVNSPLKKVNGTKTKSKHSKLKLALSQWR